MKIEVSNGEILDKLTIIELKLKYIDDLDKLANIVGDHEILKNAYEEIKAAIVKTKNYRWEKLLSLYSDLYAVNDQLWHVEDRLRKHEHEQEFGDTFIARARQVYTLNDERSAIKKEINILTKSKLIEEKSYNARSDDNL